MSFFWQDDKYKIAKHWWAIIHLLYNPAIRTTTLVRLPYDPMSIHDAIRNWSLTITSRMPVRCDDSR